MVFAKTGSFPSAFRFYHPVELILAILYALIAGIPRLSKTKILQGNGAFQQIIGLKKFPYASSLGDSSNESIPRSFKASPKFTTS